jgi:hypothetical protein
MTLRISPVKARERRTFYTISGKNVLESHS